jgi:hypothetical protein
MVVENEGLMFHGKVVAGEVKRSEAETLEAFPTRQAL